MAAASSFFGIRDEDHKQIKQQQQQQTTWNPPATAPAGSAQTAAAPVKKKRNLPGNPNPDAEVIALSPTTLMATNRFICDVCNKGFKREQNLQLHRRGHNLPWKLRQKSTKEARRRVYLCPEPTCVHHDPSRALGDLTGIKKHFCRKHGEKKWKCDKCSKRYAVQSDWKAHSKTCGTREYRCDCGTLFSRRDSFITHRAFCDALTQESARLPTSLTTLGSHLYGNNNNAMGLGLSQVTTHLSSLQADRNPGSHPSTDLLRLGGGGPTGLAQFDHLLFPATNPSSFRPPNSSPFFVSAAAASPTNQDFNGSNNNELKPFHDLMQHLPDLHSNTNTTSSAATNLFNLSFFVNGSSNNLTNTTSSTNNAAAEIFSASNNEPATLFAGTHLMSSSLYNSSMPSHPEQVQLPQMSATALLQKAARMGETTSGGRFSAQMENESQLQDLMNSLANGSAAGFGGFCGIDEAAKFHDGGSGMTRDFLGVGSIVRGMGGGMTSSQREQRSGIEHMGSLDSELKSASSASARSFAGGSMQ